MKLYNTLTRRIEHFKPLSEAAIKVYSCGPTVYNYAHIGNLRTYIFADTLRRVLENTGYSVEQAVNITDVGHLVSDGDEGEDKLEKGASREGKSVWDVAKSYTEAFLTDVKALNILPPNAYKDRSDGYARATDFIEQQITMVKLLMDKGYAYQTHQAIYFDVTKSEHYGALTGQKLEDKETAARHEVVTDNQKKHPYDFAVWFFTVDKFANHSMHWSSPWGDGFPGWHLECSAIIHSVLGDPIDIHTGGVDLIGTHHTNEIAQTQAAFGHALSNYWLHSEFILVDGVKMAKSKHNFYTLHDIINNGIDPLAYRLLVLQAHYRTQLNFTWESLQAAATNLKSIYAWADLQFQAQTSNKLKESYALALKELQTTLQNDLNTPSALAILNTMINEADQFGIDSEAVKNALLVIDSVFGLALSDRHDVTNDQRDLLLKRQTARQTQNWQESDKLRAELAEHGITVRDTDQGQIWARN